MSSPPKTSGLSLTDAGLPLDSAAAAPSAADFHDSNPARRIDTSVCGLLPPGLVPVPTSVPFKAAAPSFRPQCAEPLALGVNNSSLVDDDDDEIVHYFGKPATVPFAATTAAAKSKSSLRWEVQDQDVPTLPLFYPLEKSAVFVTRASAPDLAARIAGVMKERSISASYDPRNAMADCVTKSNVEFRVRLYRGREEYEDGVIVEVQRRWGHAFWTYMQDVFAILDAVEGKEMQ